MKLTIEQKTTKIKKLATYNRARLGALTVHDLKELCKGIIPGYTKLKKAELVEKILEITEIERQLLIKQALVSYAYLEENEVSLANLKNWYLAGIEPTIAGQTIWKKINSQGYSESTIAKSKMKQMREKIELLTLEIPECENWTEKLYTALRTFNKELSKEVNKQYAEKVEDYGDDEVKKLRHIDGAKVLNWAKNILEIAIKKDNLEKGWHEVSLALALTTGRRMAEIHGYTKFEKVGDNVIKSIGLVKKQDEDYELISPSLVDVDLWLKAYEMLPDKRKNLDAKTVNRIISSAISEALKLKVYPELGLEKYHDARDFFIGYMLETVYNRGSHGNEANFIKKIVGHESKKITASYQKLVVDIPQTKNVGHFLGHEND